MKQGIHPDYMVCTVSCTCGNTFVTRSTKPELRVDICSACHPFFTGTQKLVDTGGRVQRFADRFGSAKDMVAQREAAKKAEKAAHNAEVEAAKKAEREAKAAAKAERAAAYAAQAEKEAKQAAQAAAEQEAAAASEDNAGSASNTEASVETPETANDAQASEGEHTPETTEASAE